ncbi:hypothetical protein C7H75_25310 (plasmid) [Prescottella equi]|nr:hypothetical protein C7H75_25310 [Prescottella equi]
MTTMAAPPLVFAWISGPKDSPEELQQAVIDAVGRVEQAIATQQVQIDNQSALIESLMGATQPQSLVPAVGSGPR